MILRVTISDNDFYNSLKMACEEFLSQLGATGYHATPAEALKWALEENGGLERIRKHMVIGLCGAYLLDHAARCCFQTQKYFNFDSLGDNPGYGNTQKTFEYFEERLKVTVINNYKKEWENSEAFYIDPHRKEVFGQ